MIHEATVRAIVEQAMTAPTGDNCQPWTWTWDGQTLSIHHNSMRARHELNRKNHASLIAFGCLLEALEIAASSFGLVPEIKTQNAGHEGEARPWATIEFVNVKHEGMGITPHALYGTLKKRATDRRNYQGGSVSDAVFAEVAKLQSDDGSSRVVVKSTQDAESKEFVKFAMSSEFFLWSSKKIVRDLCHWMRLSHKEILNHQDGMTTPNMGISTPESFIMRLIRKYPVIPKMLWHLGFGIKIKQMLKGQIKSSAGVVCVTVKNMSKEAIIEGGKLAMRTWLMLNSKGYAVQPLSFLSTTIADLETGAVDEKSISSQFLKHFKKGKEILAQFFGLDDQELPLWVFRTGLSPELPVEMRAKRLSLTDVLKIRKNRQWTRVPTSYVGEIRNGQVNTKVFVQNVSKGGAGIAITSSVNTQDKPLKMNEVIETFIDMKEHGPIIVRARVAWAQISSDLASREYGLEVLDLTKEWRALVDEVIKSQPTAALTQAE